jgi:hypothetical protein
MGKARFKLTGWLIERAFNLPYGARIVNIQSKFNEQTFNNEYTIYVESLELPNEVEIFPVWDVSNFNKFIDWGIPNTYRKTWNELP